MVSVMGFSTAVYMDYNATAPLRADAQAAMVDVITSVAGNASSVHAPGRAAHRALDLARTRVAAAIGGDPKGVVFTSSATEANNLALKGWALGGDVGQRRSVVTTMTEHPSVLAPLRWLKSRGHLSGRRILGTQCPLLLLLAISTRAP